MYARAFLEAAVGQHLDGFARSTPRRPGGACRRTAPRLMPDSGVPTVSDGLPMNAIYQARFNR